MYKSTVSIVDHLSGTHQCLDAAVVIGDTLHISGVLPVGYSLVIQSAPPQDQPWMGTQTGELTSLEPWDPRGITHPKPSHVLWISLWLGVDREG